MATYKQGEDKRYLSALVAALIVIAAAVSFFVYSLIVKDEVDETAEILVEEIDGVPYVSPGPGMLTPDSSPNIAPPTSPPPGA